MGKINQQAKNGFTFVEILVTVSVIGLVLPIIFSIVFTIFQQQAKIYRISEVKKQGDDILNQSKNLITNMTGIYSESGLINEQCDGLTSTSYGPANNGSNFYFKDKNDVAINIYVSDAQVATGPSNLNITNNKVEVTNFQISCENTNQLSSAFVTVKFDINYKTASTRKEDAASLSYQSSYKLRN